MGDLFERAIHKLETGAAVVGTSDVRKSRSADISPQVSAPQFTLDMDTLQRSGMLTPDTLQGRMGEEYRIVKRLLLMSAFGKGVPQVEQGNAIVVTSSLEGEGKTFTAFNLAMSIAQERDSTVLLIDADITRRTLSRIFHAGDATGLSDLLSDIDLDPADVIGRTNVEKLRFIPAGNIRDDAAELVASSQMERLFSELASRYADRIILFDSPPLLATSQAAVLARLVGQVLMVVEDGRTPQAALREATGMIDEEKLVGMVLNRCGGSKRGGYYGGYYGPVAGSEDAG